MKKWLWLLLVISGAIVVMGISGFFQQPETLPVVENTPIEKPQAQPEQQNNTSIPLVSADQLLAHIQKLNFQRFTPKERSHSRTYITTQLRKFGWKPQIEKFPTGVNIFAQKQGTDKAAGAILIAAHYDTVEFSPGADDNSTGVAVVLEVARLFATHPTSRTLQLAFFDKEETGLLGSQAFVKKAARLKNIQGVIVMDMVGYACYTSGCQQYPTGLPVTPPSDKGDFLAVVGDMEHLPLLNAFNSTNQNLPAVLTLPIPFKGLLTPDTLRSDHAPFWYQGVGAVLVTDTANLRSPNYHQPSDLPKNIDRAFFTGSAQIIVNATNTLLEKSGVLTTQPAT
ncbi:M28 family peptidase [Anabaena cylindrica FACHB-243]|uniref:Peptidase M28 n=1 Tax=Anabaena cylindrica (strain ATCC 27899 / PCC 7122) TaxID=272123 RepID=K9ZG71_ANACC|nr:MULTISPECIES: M20/M25/M40 family metallo-hydrolase [Anabaena]AFZ57734.1 peptidase M28 [Anabaena cylindrica PCC 7122]AZL96628.1 peptidase M28 [Anabaena sp. CCAP 1446/1C]MBD2419353.1 M28 family peptidase [Anabaena cylindrica FACHB-243]MBY5285645.1 M28 family peptidase [Anabaena sp. CCAP 1446/1C]MBY5310996.1 M28 family peptidase [Anabaena sp. CCAP 1446/1C]